ncbi:MAG: hypothetical protein R3F05_20435 [Planctomycetota bacterium]
MNELFDWANALLANPPRPLDKTDAHFMGAMAFAGMCHAMHGRTGISREDSCFGWLRFALRAMIGTPPGVHLGDAVTDWYLRLLDRWIEEVYPGRSDEHAAKSDAVHAEMTRALPRLMSGLTWEGDMIKGYMAAARSCNRGGWSRLRADMERVGAIDARFGSLDDQLFAMLEGGRLERAAFARTKAGLLAPAFGAAIDTARRDHLPAKRQQGDDLSTIHAPDPHEHWADLVAQSRDHEALTRLRGLVETFRGRRTKSKYERAVREHAWRLLTGTDPSALARELGLDGRPMRREWARHLDRMEGDRTLGPIIKRLRAG